MTRDEILAALAGTHEAAATGARLLQETDPDELKRSPATRADVAAIWAALYVHGEVLALLRNRHRIPAPRSAAGGEVMTRDEILAALAGTHEAAATGARLLQETDPDELKRSPATRADVAAIWAALYVHGEVLALLLRGER